jgi:3-oxoacyl-[acyl-carrier protein] reductase
MNAALENGMKALALDLARYRIRVLTVSPGPFDTDRLKNIFVSQSAERGVPVEEIRRRESAAMPLGRFGEPAEIGRLVAWLVSEEATYITGVVVTIDGGFSPGY